MTFDGWPGGGGYKSGWAPKDCSQSAQRKKSRWPWFIVAILVALAIFFFWAS